MKSEIYKNVQLMWVQIAYHHTKITCFYDSSIKCQACNTKICMCHPLRRMCQFTAEHKRLSTSFTAILISEENHIAASFKIVIIATHNQYLVISYGILNVFQGKLPFFLYFRLRSLPKNGLHLLFSVYFRYFD